MLGQVALSKAFFRYYHAEQKHLVVIWYCWVLMTCLGTFNDSFLAASVCKESDNQMKTQRFILRLIIPLETCEA